MREGVARPTAGILLEHAQIEHVRERPKLARMVEARDGSQEEVAELLPGVLQVGEPPAPLHQTQGCPEGDVVGNEDGALQRGVTERPQGAADALERRTQEEI